MTKKYIVRATKVQTSYLSWHWGVMQILKKNWLVVWKKTWEFCKFSPEHLKVSKLEHWWGPFVQSRKGMTLEFTEELCVMTMKNNARGSNKKHRRVRIISNFISYFYQPSDNIAMFSPLLHTSKKGLSFPFSLSKKIIYLETQLKGELTDLFSKLTGHPCSHRQSRIRMMNTFMIVNIAP